MKLTDAIQAAKEQDAPIRIASQPDIQMMVSDGKFYYFHNGKIDKTDNPMALTLDQIISDDWEFEKRIWVGKRERKTEVSK